MKKYFVVFLFILSLNCFSQSRFDFSGTLFLTHKPSSDVTYSGTNTGFGFSMKRVISLKSKLEFLIGIEYDNLKFSFDRSMNEAYIPEEIPFRRYLIIEQIGSIPLGIKVYNNHKFYLEGTLSPNFCFSHSGRKMNGVFYSPPGEEKLSTAYSADNNLSTTFIDIVSIGMGKQFQLKDKHRLYFEIEYKQNVFIDQKVSIGGTDISEIISQRRIGFTTGWCF